MNTLYSSEAVNGHIVTHNASFSQSDGDTAEKLRYSLLQIECLCGLDVMVETQSLRLANLHVKQFGAFHEYIGTNYGEIHSPTLASLEQS